MRTLTASKLYVRRTITSVTLSVAVATTVVSATAPAEAAGHATLRLECHDEHNTFKAVVTLDGPGGPKAKYDVDIKLFDYIDDTRAPRVRLISYNMDSSVTNYPWRTGGQGRNVLSQFSTTLQQPKGLRALLMEAETDRDSNLFNCSDYAPKK
ncbi:hypothetical protein [Streptomyces anandii]|uniref:hypothetical protein n=1 Tax=Streptomyces anandii TaxID=285454 RepID=UPI00367BF3B8